MLPVVHRNAYFMRSENILLAMATEKRPSVRELGWRKNYESKK